MFDVFYKGKKPNLFPFELPANSLKECANLSRTKFFWFVDGNNDYTNFDFNWRASPWEESHVHCFPSQWQRTSGTYFANKWCVDNPQWNFRTEQSVTRLPSKENWTIPDYIDINSIDFSWHPDELDSECEYHFPSQWQSSSGVTYGSSVNKKFIDVFSVRTISNKKNWNVPNYIDENSVDFSWHPNSLDPPYIYHFPSQWQIHSGVTYTTKNATEIREEDIFEVRAIETNNWIIPDSIDSDTVQKSWHPDVLDPPYNYHFSSKYQSSSGVIFSLQNAKDIKISDAFTVETLEDTGGCWSIPKNIDRSTIDFKWHPNPLDPPYIYHFPSQWQSSSGVTYTAKNATEIKLIADFQVTSLPSKECWEIPEDIDESKIDFSWHPNPLDPPYIYHFPSEWQTSSGLIYHQDGGIEIRLEESAPTTQPKVSKPLSIFFIDKMNSQSQKRFESLKEKYPDIQKVRFMNSEIATISRCCQRSKTQRFWVISSENIYDDFDFSWQPATWQRHMTHVFGSKWEKWSFTYQVNRLEFERHTKWANAINEFPNLNFVEEQKINVPIDRCEYYWLDWGNPTSAFEELQKRLPKIKRTRVVGDYLSAFKRIVETAQTEFIWILNSVCDYSKFDFTWTPEPWQEKMIHCFPSSDQKRGDTFYVPVEEFRSQMNKLELLDWFNTINYCEDQNAPRLDCPVVISNSDNLPEIVKEHHFDFPYSLFTTGAIVKSSICLWREKDRVAESFNKSHNISIIPKDVKNYLNAQIYDYPYLNLSRDEELNDHPLDIVYISNGEPDEERWYEKTCEVSKREVKWVRGVNGRSLAYQTAASKSDTPWFFTVFAKLEIVDNFDFMWQPDYWQGRKHWIFYSRNPLNGLEYGHQGLIVYNKQLVLETKDIKGLDYTLSAPHGVVPTVSGIAHYNQSPWMTWRTAFREVVKLKHYQSTHPSVETDYRLDIWMSVAIGEYGEWSIQGARDAVEYYEQVRGEYKFLLDTFDWDWLKNYSKGYNFSD